MVERTETKGEGSRKAAAVRKQGASRPQPKYPMVFKYVNRRVGQARCSTQVFVVSRHVFASANLLLPVLTASRPLSK